MPDPEREQSVDVALEVLGDGLSARFGQVDGRHGQNEAKQVIALVRAQVDLKLEMHLFKRRIDNLAINGTQRFVAEISNNLFMQ